MNGMPVAEAIKTALGHEKNKHYQQAEFIYRRLVQSFPAEAAYHEKLMEMLYRQRRFEESYAAFSDFVALQPDNDEAEYEPIYLQALRATTSRPWPVQRRARFRVLTQLLAETHSVDGDVAECGCYQGLSSYLMCSYLHKRDPAYRGAGYRIFDSFQGLSAPTLEDEVPDGFERAKQVRSMCVQGAFAAGLEQVKRNLGEFPDIEFHPGWIPLTFQGLPERKYRFVHVDVDLYDPTLESFEYFYPRLATGGIIASDDYDWPGARQALEEFCREYGLKLNLTPYNQAFVKRAG
jgi:O-methyltransferase